MNISKDKYEIIKELLLKGIRNADLISEKLDKRELAFKKHWEKMDKLTAKLLSRP